MGNVMIGVVWIMPFIVYCVIKKAHTHTHVYMYINRIWEIKYAFVAYVIIVTLSSE
jgi:hypothetical protein